MKSLYRHNEPTAEIIRENLKVTIMAKQLYVGNLSLQADGEMLKTLFSMFGTVVRAHIVLDKQTGQSKGYGFVVMSSDVEAQSAIKVLDGKKCGEFTVKVQESNGKG